MSNTFTSRTRTLFRTRCRAAVVTAGLCASVALTSGGVAMAADTAPSSAAPEKPEKIATELVSSTAKAAEKADEKADEKAGEKKDAPSWITPITAKYTLTATYGNSGDRWVSTHSGQDFAVPTGTAVRAVHEGTVVKAGGYGAGDGPAYGNAVVIKHSNGTYTQYAHLSKVKVSVGQQVKTGERVALSGNTGNSSGPHLHFEVRTTPDYGSSVDPMAFLRGKGADA